MPTRRIHWSPWPFAPNQVVTLYWIRSPQRDPVSGQWMTTAVFQDDAQRLHEVSVPWGFLPWLKLGRLYRNGVPVRDASQGCLIAIDDLDQWDVQIAEAGQVIPRTGYPLRTAMNLAEFCWVYSRGARTVVVPQFEAVRSVVAPTRFLALGCLQPSFLDTIVRDYDIKGDILYMEFSKDMPVRLLTRATVLQLAHLLLDPSLRRCWDALYPYQRRIDSGRMACPPPDVRNLVVRGQPMLAATLLVYEVLEAKLYPLPVHQVLWRHPQSELEPEWNETKIRWHRVDAAGKDLALDKRVAATGSGSILVDGMGAIRDTHRIQVRRWAVESRRTRNWRVLTKERTEFRVSGADVGSGAKRQSVDVTLESPQGELLQRDSDDGLNDFWPAIQWMKQDAQGYVAVHVFDSLGEQGFWTVDGKPRRVAMVRVVLPSGDEATILEFARPDKYPISTLIVANILDQDEIKTLLPSLLFREGGWNGSALDRQWGSHYHLLRHLSRPPRRWAALLTDWARIMWGTRSNMV
ncbi:hypothetical protein SAMN00768000_2161 [Sulfobacillus thermosulfidooxidans DSM 9293]|uniref:Uncharacterized protein n=2 Tax=Sulfobacillus thermosulfidooxidans TaxID=28034 RepID=A0A1W1WGD4_SULTA|nr:hypothetical protein SAMN00768000_2161 [Sulfobacillus thermosulfidooxidans DSM 9293]